MGSWENDRVGRNSMNSVKGRKPGEGLSCDRVKKDFVEILLSLLNTQNLEYCRKNQKTIPPQMKEQS